MSGAARQRRMTPEQYLAGERDAPSRHEYVLGELYAMAGASDAHVTVSGNAFALLKAHLRGSDCRVYMADMKVRCNEGEAFFYPDVMVGCDPSDRQRSYFKDHPKLIIEVLSPATEAFDRGGKFAHYREIGSLTEYALIDSREHRVDIFRREPDGRWEFVAFTGEDANVPFRSVDLTVPMRALYEDVDFSMTDAEA